MLNGVVYSRDGRLLYVSTGDTGSVDVYDTADWRKIRRLSLDASCGGATYKQSFSGALTLSPDGQRLFAIDQGN